MVADEIMSRWNGFPIFSRCKFERWEDGFDGGEATKTMADEEDEGEDEVETRTECRR